MTGSTPGNASWSTGRNASIRSSSAAKSSPTQKMGLASRPPPPMPKRHRNSKFSGLGTLTRPAGEGGPSPEGWVGEGTNWVLEPCASPHEIGEGDDADRAALGVPHR